MAKDYGRLPKGGFEIAYQRPFWWGEAPERFEIRPGSTTFDALDQR